MRLIEFQGSMSGRRGWMGPVMLGLAGVGAVVLLFVGAIVSLAVVAAGGLLKLLSLAAGETRRPEVAGRPSMTALMGTWAKKLLFKGGAAMQRGWGTKAGAFGAEQEAPGQPGVNGENSKGGSRGSEKTISLDRGKDGVWRP